MDFGIARMQTDWAGVRCYRLYDSRNRLLLIADHGTPWMAPDPGGQVRFARATGDLVATMDLTWPARLERNGRHHVAHAVIINHAVYAILNKYWDATDKEQETFPYFVLEAENQLWLAMPKTGERLDYAVYDKVPSDLMIHDRPQQSDLPDPVGYIYRGIGEFDYSVVIPLERLSHTALIILALVFLIDNWTTT